MTVNAKIDSTEISKAGALVKVLTEQRRALIAAGSSKLIIDQYMGLIRFLKSATSDELRRVLIGPDLAIKEVEEPERSDNEISNLDRAEIQTLITDEYTSRKL